MAERGSALAMPIRLLTFLRLFVAALALHASGAFAQQFVEIKAREANMRSGPGERHAVQWSLSRGYPLQVISRRGEWLQVRDVEKDSGWVHRSLTGKSQHMAVKSRVANVRQQPRTNARQVGQLQHGDVVRVLERRGDWVRVRPDAGQAGWVSRNLLWGS
jgi:SH3-like domain-containing protein